MAPVVVYTHKDPVMDIPGYPAMSHATDVAHHRGRDGVAVPEHIQAARTPENAIKFLAGADVVVTDGYHGAFWAQLLGKAVVLLDGRATKFHRLPADLPIVRSEDFLRDPHVHIEAAKALAEKHREVGRIGRPLLDSARRANLDFGRTVEQAMEARGVDVEALPTSVGRAVA